MNASGRRDCGQGSEPREISGLVSMSGGDSKKADMEAVVLECSYMPRLVKKCILLECGGLEQGTLGCRLTVALVRTQLLSVCYGSFKALVNRRTGLEAAASSCMGNLLAGVSIWPSLAWDLNS